MVSFSDVLKSIKNLLKIMYVKHPKDISVNAFSFFKILDFRGDTFLGFSGWSSRI